LDGGFGLKVTFQMFGILFCYVWCGYWGKVKSALLKIQRATDQLESLLIRTLFNWSCAWDFTHENSILKFRYSLHFCV